MSLRIALLSSLVLLSTGCAGPRIRAEFDSRLAQKQTLERTARPVQQANQEPYQLAFRIGPGFLDKTSTALFGDLMSDPEKLKAARGKASGAQNGGAGTQEAGGGQIGGGQGGGLGFLRGGGEGGGPLQRIAGGLLGGGGGLLGGGGAGGELNLTPQFETKDVAVNFPAQCPGCLKLRFDLEGGVKSQELRGIKLGGQVTVAARIQATEQKGEPALELGIYGVDQLQLQLPIQLPGPFARLQEQLEEGMRDGLTQQIRANSSQTTRVIPLGKKFQAGGLTLEGLGVHTRPSPGGELFVGLNTTFNAAPSIRFRPEQSGLENADWGIVLSDSVVTAFLLKAVQDGKVPARYNTQGKPDPEGKVGLTFDRMRFTPQGFELDARVWYLGWPAFWRDYTIAGTLGLESGQLKPKLTEMRAGKGSGAAFLTVFAERRMNSERALTSMGKTFPQELPLPIGEGKVLKMLPVQVRPEAGALVITGSMEVGEKTGKEAGKEAGNDGQKAGR